MQVIHARNVNDAYLQGMFMIKKTGELIETRNGPAYRTPFPVTTSYDKPMERVLFEAGRDANPFFHFFESLWMLAGKNDVAFLTQFVKRMGEFSDDGQTFNAAYGFRWRAHFEQDQINEAVKLLTKDPSTRRCVIGMWDPSYDLGFASADIPCNLGVKLEIVRGRLNSYVFNRSNDIIWGCYGANMVHMSMLQEYVAGLLGVKVGTYHQISTDYHAYKSVFDDKFSFLNLERLDDSYRDEDCSPFPMGDLRDGNFDIDLNDFFNGKLTCFYSPFFQSVVEPMYQAFSTWKKSRHNITSRILATDWRIACDEWIKRRTV